ncbi:YlcI/YnfO family protein [uncultured Gilliamella sp.]|uniref:YlcI/YnfO family protein n=1 Tax=uncultured Gilliamella sp. TaxID=1193505 RepID=UPI0034163781
MATGYKNNKSFTKGIRFPHDLIEQIDEQAKKENTNFSAWVIATCREKLAKSNKK